MELLDCPCGSIIIVWFYHVIIGRIDGTLIAVMLDRRFVSNIMNLKRYVKDHIEYDRIGEKKIYKAIRLWHKGGFVNKLRAIFLHNSNRRKYACNIPPQVNVGPNFHIMHCQNVFLGETTVIGDNCRVFQSVNIIAKVKGDDYSSKVRRHAQIGNDCILGACCTIIGDITIGDDCIIAAGAMVTKDVPPHSVVKGLNQVRPKRLDDYNVPPWLVNGKEVYQRGPEEYFL